MDSAALEVSKVGRPKKEIAVRSTRLEEDAYALARRAAAIRGQSIVVYLSALVREHSPKVIYEDTAKLKEQEAEKVPEPPPEPEPAPKARPRKGRKGGDS